LADGARNCDYLLAASNGRGRPAEAEYIIDRRRLGAVTDIDRFAQLPVISN
jgi:hypothetical protein